MNIEYGQYIPTDRKINLYWIRHAESCTNFNFGMINENINDSTFKLNKRETIEQHIKYHPNLSFIGMQQAIKLGDFLKTIHFDYIIVSSTLRTIMTALIAFRNNQKTKIKKIIVAPFIYEKIEQIGDYEYQNYSVNSIRLKKMTSFIKKWLAKSWVTYFDDVETIDILNSYNHILKTIKITTDEQKNIINNQINKIKEIMKCKQYINRKHSEIVDDTKYEAKYSICVKSIIKRIRYLRNILIKYEMMFKSLLDSNNSLLIDKIINHLQHFMTDKTIEEYFKGPDVDFTLLEKYEKMESNNIKKNFNRFYTDILYKLIKGIDYGQNINICCFNHGNLLRKHFMEKYDYQYNKSRYGKKIPNTGIFLEMIKTYNTNHKTFIDFYDRLKGNYFNQNIYEPSHIRELYDIENDNINICAINSIYGYINKDKLKTIIPKKFTPDIYFARTLYEK
jgi:hypothetical protein